MKRYLIYLMIAGLLALSGCDARKESDSINEREIDTSEVYISGPLAANAGELCVFRLNKPGINADWAIVRQTNDSETAAFYVDTAGSALTFSSNIAAKYTIVAAIVEKKRAKIILHVCDYGTTPSPEPEPTPKPQPEPQSLVEWVRQNVPDAGKSQSAALASCYESAAIGIKGGSIKTQEAAFSAIRTNTQTKIKADVWKDFLGQLSEKIVEKLAGSNDITMLGDIFTEIASGLNQAQPKSEVQAGVTRSTSHPVVMQPIASQPVISRSVVIPMQSNTCTGPNCPTTYYGGLP